MRTFQHSLLILVFIVGPLFNCAQVLSPEQMKSDLDVLEENLFLTHIDIDRYHTEDEIRASFKSIRDNLKESMHAVEFYRELLPIFSLIANGHTTVRPPKSYFDSMRVKAPRFPFDLFDEDGRILVLRDMTPDSLVGVGSEILSVNGRAVSQLIDEMVANMTRDGFNETLPRHNAVTAFKSFYAFHYGCPPVFELEYRDTEGELKTARLAGQSLKSIGELRKERYTKFWPSWGDEDYKAYSLEIQDGVGIMTLNTFSKKYVKKTDGRSYKKFFKEAFEQLEQEGIEHLVIDLRNNGGGDPEPTIDLFAYLHPEPFTFYRSIRTRVSHVPNRKLYEEGLFFDNLFARFVTRKREEGQFDVKGVPGLKESKPKGPHFDGKVYLLTGPQSFSATGEMTAIIKEHDRALFIGQEPGGNPNVNVSGFMPKILLPHSQVQVRTSLVRFEMNVNFDSEGRGIIPDHIVAPAFEDARTGEDTVMEFTLNLIATSK